MYEWYQENQPNLKIWLKIFLKYPLWSIAAKLENTWTKSFLQEVEKESCEWNSIYQILILPPMNCYPAMFPGKNIPNIARSNHIFPGKGRGDKDFILTYLDSSMADAFLHYCLIFSDFGHLQDEKRGQCWTKSANFRSVYFP